MPQLAGRQVLGPGDRSPQLETSSRPLESWMPCPGPAPKIAPAGIGDLFGYLSRFAPGRPFVAALRHEHPLVVLAKDEDHLSCFVVHHGYGLIHRQIAVVEKNLKRAPGESLIGASLQNQIDVGIVAATVPASLCKCQDRSLGGHHQGRNAEAVVSRLTPGKDGDLPERLGNAVPGGIGHRAGGVPNRQDAKK